MQTFNQQNALPQSTSQGFMQPIVPSMQSGSQGQQMINPMTNDPNSVETFKQNIQTILEYVMRTQNIARSALNGITNAYHPGSSSAQTQADLANLQQNLHLISDMMRHSGVGALPLLAAPPSPVVGPTNDVSMSQEPTPPAEDTMVADATRSIEVLYDRLRKVQEAAGVVGNLLGSSQNQTLGLMGGSQGGGTPNVPPGPGGVSSGFQGRLVSRTGSDGRGGSQTR
ncbi:hypothetical protein E1B28_006141 [Marasmius oreades]|uniref:Uncharacterized protein n=1 Tax=Marasmius oreades TaxID=181124 RepID=A0A9P7S4Z6_9AGAR|nr:uncharacterized protein E1B28_006141 [Marasmius oreades]KAG7095385.1 hypothetical protein E1B28_006141 [Marasmius oreades]